MEDDREEANLFRIGNYMFISANLLRLGIMTINTHALCLFSAPCACALYFVPVPWAFLLHNCTFLIVPKVAKASSFLMMVLPRHVYVTR